MNDMVLKKKKSTSPIIFIFCMIVGACLLGISFKELIDYNTKSDTYTPIEAKVIKHTYKNGKVTSVILEYEVDEIIYNAESSHYDDCVKSYGSAVDIMYEPDNPENIIFVNREINIIIPIAAIVVLSVGIAIILVEIFDGIRKIKYKIFKSYSINNTQIQKQEEVIDISDVYKKPDPIPVTNKEEIKEEVKEEIKQQEKPISSEVKEEVIDIPFTNEKPEEKKVEVKELDKKYESVDYRKFITELEDIDDIPSFIPNADELNNRESNN